MAPQPPPQPQPPQQQAVDVREDEEGRFIWHASSAEECLQALGSSPDNGLSEADAVERLKTHGPNLLTPPPQPGFLKKLWLQINT